MSEEAPDARALRESEQRFRALAEAAREAILINENGIIREVNPALTELLGFTREELLGRDGTELLAPESRAAVQASIRSPGRGGTSEIVIFSKSGQRRLFESTSAPIMYQGRPMRVVTMQDVTDRRAAEVALHQSDERLRSAMSAARMGSWEWQVPQNTITWSPEMFGVYGVDVANFAGTFEAYISLVHPDDRARVRHTVEGCLRGHPTSSPSSIACKAATAARAGSKTAAASFETTRGRPRAWRAPAWTPRGGTSSKSSCCTANAWKPRGAWLAASLTTSTTC
jgi:PAS domain S-box-containing protein